MKLKATVVDGGGHEWTDLEQARLAALIGTPLYSGTFNLRFEHELQLNQILPARLADQPCFLLPTQPAFRNTGKVVAAKHLRSTLNLQTGDQIELQLCTAWAEGELQQFIFEAAEKAESILDVGCGPGRWQNLFPQAAALTSVDGYAKDLMQARGMKICGLVQDVLPGLPDCGFDVVFALDLVEHLPELQALETIRQMKRLARKKVCILIPLGVHPQEAGPDNPLQEHRSTWYPMDLRKLGFTVHVWPDFHTVAGMSPMAMWAEWRRE